MTNGKLFCLADGFSEVDLKRLRRQEQFYCPQCSEKLILRVGSKRMAHFAHERGSLCSLSHYERESEYHIRGKLHLYQWLKSQGLNPQLELFLKEINQRTDIAVTLGDINYCLEFQCSTIPEELFLKRTKMYLDYSYQPIWILAGQSIRRVADDRLKLSSFDYLFTRKGSPTKWFIPAYCPITKQLILIKNIQPTSSRNAIAQFSIIPLQKAQINEILTPKIDSSISVTRWKQQIDKMKMNVMMRPTLQQRRFLNELYVNHLNLQLLPPMIGIPVEHGIFIETPPFIWQSYIIMDVLMKKKVGDLFSFKQVLLFFLKRYRNRDIALRKLPLVGECDLQLLVREYLEVLTRFGLLQKVDDKHYRIKEILKKAKNMDEQLKMEHSFYHQYETIAFK